MLLPSPAAAQPVDFATQIQPIFQKRCAACHGTAQQLSGFRLDQKAKALAGGYNGPAVVPGSSATSPLIGRVTSDKKNYQMPPAGPRLSEEEVSLLRAWIDQGAVWPEDALTAKFPEGKDQKPKSGHWSFQPIQRPDPPAVLNRAWPRNEIDKFILARLEDRQIAPSAEADKVTLARRVSLDLTGLPPTPEQIDEFLLDNRPEAYERLVDRLLASPHYGEKWARSWLDLARYADSDGYEKDLARPWAWRWRQWVIEAMNRDMPYDQFTKLQLAGDLLPDAGPEERLATGFHYNTLLNREAGVDRREARFEQIIDRANTVGTVWLGLSVGCAQCHDHKFDPISQKDYYSLFAFFNSQDDVVIDAPLPGEMGPYLQALPEYERKRRQILEERRIPELQPAWEEKIRHAMDHPGQNLDFDFSVTSMRAMLDNADKLLKTPVSERSENDKVRLTNYFVSTPGPEYSKSPSIKSCIDEARDLLRDLDKEFPNVSQAYVLREDPKAAPTHIAVRGDWRTQGLQVEPSTLSALPALPKDNRPDRVRLAEWLFDEANPLTARVAVNRAWQSFFGNGLVKTPNDFGSQGEKPSHPELLDWLATEYRRLGWSQKKLHRLIVTSAAYRQSSHARPDLQQIDPENTLIARQSRLRLPAEYVRDAMLVASGLLYPEVGGESIKPPQPEGVSALTYANGAAWKETTGPERYKRGLYVHYQRTSPHPQLVNFDAPDSSFACTRRNRSNTPLQALNLLNDPVFFEGAQALAYRVLTETEANWQNRLDRAFRLTYGRSPSGPESERLRQFYAHQKSILDQEPDSVKPMAPPAIEGVERLDAATWVALSRVLMNTDEFITRE